MFHKTIKGSKGFTLVEVIVVAVIVAVLAAVAVPLYLNYIKTSRDQVASHTAGSIATFCASCQNGGGTVGGISTTAASDFNVTCTGGSGDGTTLHIPADVTAKSSTLTSPGVITVKHTATGATDQTANW